jgi:molybdopterin converting factor small subunit
MKIRLQYYAVLRDERGLDEETRQTGARTPHELYQELKSGGCLRFDERFIRPARNDRFCDWDEVLAENDLVVFVPPVSGG